jgi:UDP-glucose 4-epimerase
MDDLSGGTLDGLPVDHPSFRFVQCDVGSNRDGGSVREAVHAADFVFHLASPIGVAEAHERAFETTSHILNAGINLVDKCRRSETPLLFASSSEIYGPGGSDRLWEEDCTRLDIRPRWGYAAAKFAIEHLVAGLVRDCGVPGWIVRLFNIVGPGQRPETGLIVPAFCAAALCGEPLIVHGDGSARRSFLHVDDAVTGLLAIVGSSSLRGRPVNLGGTETHTVQEVADCVVSAAGRGETRHVPHEQVYGAGFAEAHERCPDLSLLFRHTGWRPRHNLAEAVQGCLETLRAPELGFEKRN